MEPAAATPEKPVKGQLKTAADLSNRFDQLRRSRMLLERQWRLNLAFYKGKQYSFFAPKSDRLESLATEEGEKPRHRVRIVSNQIIGGSHALLAQLTKTKPQMYATPGSGSDHDVKASQMAERLLEFWWSDFKLDSTLDEALLWSIVAGQGYWKIDWDAQAGKPMRFMLDPQGQPIIDDSLKDAFRSELEAQGIEPQEKVVYLGDIKVEAMSPFDVYLDPAAKIFEDCKYAICVHYMDPAEIKARWKVEVKADAVPTTPDTTLPYSNAENASAPTVRKVFIGYWIPSPSTPNGRVVAWIDGSDKQILEDKAWSYPTNELPLVKFPGLRVPGGVYDDAPITHAIPLQKELNKTISQIVEYKNLTINPVMTAPIGSLRTRRTNEPGQVLEYAPIGQHKPEFEQLPSLPPYVFEHLKDISGRLREAFFSVDVLEGKVPPNVEAGISIDLLQEMASDRLAPIIKLLELGLARAGQQMLSLAQVYYIEPRLLKIRGSGGSTQVKKFTQADIAGGVVVYVEAGSGLPRTRAGRQARVERLVEMNIIPLDKAHKYLDLADLKGLTAQYEADEDMAYREIEKIITGQTLNQVAAQDAVQALQQGQNPETGQPLTPQDNPEQIIHRAGLQPLLGEDWDVHLDVLGFYMKGVEYESLPIEVQRDMQTHWSATLTAKLSVRPLPQPETPKVNLQIKTTAGPTAFSKIMERAGVDITPEDATEPPLETWVSDSIDDPDADAAGPGQEAAHLSKAAAGLIDAKTKIADSQAQNALNNMAHAQDTQHKEASHQQKLRHAEQAHQHALRQKSADASTAEKRAKQSSFKPKPKAKGK